MKEKDFEKNLDNLIIKGLIQEAEQNNADFEVAMREMSDEDFLALIYDAVTEQEVPIYENQPERQTEKRPVILNKALRVSNEMLSDAEESVILNETPKSAMRQEGWKIWAASIASAAAILLILLIPAYRNMDSRICESALLASEAYMLPSKSADIISMQQYEVKEMLPQLEKQYEATKLTDDEIRQAKTQDPDNNDYYLMHASPQEAGMDLVQAYLKLNRKDKAIGVLRELADKDNDPEFAEQCKKMLEILE